MTILANALDAMEETNKGRCYEALKADPNQVTIRTRAVKMATDEPWIEVAIADNGPGIL